MYLLAIQPPLAIPAVVRQFGKILKFLFFFSDLSVELLRCELKVLRYTACHEIRAINHCSIEHSENISRIKLVIEVQEAVGSSISVRISDLIESYAVVFTVSDKQDNFVEEEFELFTASIINFDFILL